MQIHELTRRRPVQEASLGGAIGGLGRIAGGLGAAAVTTAGKAVVQGLAAGSGIDANVIAPGGLSSNGDRAGTAGKYTAQQAQPFATQIQKAWAQMVQVELKNSGATTLAQIDSAGNEKLKTQLTAMVNDMINANSYGGSGYENLASNVAAEPRIQQAAKITSGTIAKAINDIFTATASPTAANNAAATAKMFLTLAQNGILPAQHLLKFYPKAGAASNSSTAAAGSEPLTPGAQKLARTLKIDMASLPAVQAKAQANPTEATQQFKELLGIK